MIQERNTKQSGFTLIELSIVLVIIGLIVGGVLVGQDLIKAAKVRATVSQVEKYNAAANTFRSKYSGLPGDLANPQNYFGTANQAGTVGLADGNRLIEGAGAAAGVLSGEPTVFWGMLATANLTPDLTNTLDYTATPAGNLDTTFPQAKLGGGNRFVVLGQNNLNYFILGNPTTATVDAAVINIGLTPTQAFQIDTKLDDGAPGTGTVLSILDQASGATPTPATYSQSSAESAAGCAASASLYDIAAHGDKTDCLLGIRSSF